MHDTSMNNMRDFVRALPSEGKVLDVGGLNINGSYRGLFGPRWEYTGLDVIPGENVDYVPSDPYDWEELENESFDAVISGQAVEHIEFPERTFREIARVLKPDGRLCMIGPSVPWSHSEPWYRACTDDLMRKLAEDAGLIVDSVRTSDVGIWHDCILKAHKTLDIGKIAPKKGKMKTRSKDKDHGPSNEG